MNITAGQVWVVKAGENDGGEAGEPVMIDRFEEGYIDYFYFRRGKFKNWCVNGVKPK